MKQIRIPSRDYTTTTPDQILTPEEVNRIIEACQKSRERSRDRAIISTLYESGCRIGELGRLRWRDLVFDAHGVKMTITDQKKNKIRYSRLVSSSEYLVRWKNETRTGAPRTAPWCSCHPRGAPMDYASLVMVIRKTATRAGITKRVHPHLFRKSRITHMIQQNFQESVIKQMMWSNLATSMFRTYACLCNDDIDAEVLNRCGL